MNQVLLLIPSSPSHAQVWAHMHIHTQSSCPSTAAKEKLRLEGQVSILHVQSPREAALPHAVPEASGRAPLAHRQPWFEAGGS